MTKKKRSLFERLTGSVHVEDEKEEQKKLVSEKWQEEANDAQLTVDVYQTPSEIIIQSMVAGVRPEDLDVNITREMVTIKGTREKSRELHEDDFFYRELYWGSFSRSILLPQEVEVEKAEAGIKNGLLTIRLPKINKEKSSSLKVKIY